MRFEDYVIWFSIRWRFNSPSSNVGECVRVVLVFWRFHGWLRVRKFDRVGWKTRVMMGMIGSDLHCWALAYADLGKIKYSRLGCLFGEMRINMFSSEISLCVKLYSRVSVKLWIRMKFALHTERTWSACFAQRFYLLLTSASAYFDLCGEYHVSCSLLVWDKLYFIEKLFELYNRRQGSVNELVWRCFLVVHCQISRDIDYITYLTAIQVVLRELINILLNLSFVNLFSSFERLTNTALLNPQLKSLYSHIVIISSSMISKDHTSSIQNLA
jgi:hypothetical protein